MPILARETSLFPNDLLLRALEDFADASSSTKVPSRWWAMYTRSRQEKQLMRKLLAKEVAFCCPIIERRHRSPSGRVRRVYDPLFPNYVFVFGDESARYTALTTNCVSRCQEVGDGLQLTQDLEQIQRLIETGQPLSPESRLVAGDRVRVKSGSFVGYEGAVIRRGADTRLVVTVGFMQQGASVQLDDCQLEIVGRETHHADVVTESKGSIDVVYKPR